MLRGCVGLALCVSIGLGACDLRAAPKAAPPRDAPPSLGDAAPAADADVASLCMTAANHIADVVIAEGDQTMRVEVTKDRGRMVQTIANGCLNEHWSDDWIACATKAPNRAAIDRCHK